MPLKKAAYRTRECFGEDESATRSARHSLKQRPARLAAKTLHGGGDRVYILRQVEERLVGARHYERPTICRTDVSQLVHNVDQVALDLAVPVNGVGPRVAPPVGPVAALTAVHPLPLCAGIHHDPIGAGEVEARPNQVEHDADHPWQRQ